jgi:hypothetical protein
MTDRPPSPFTRLDTSLLRSTRTPLSAPAEPAQDQNIQPEAAPAAEPSPPQPRRGKRPSLARRKLDSAMDSELDSTSAITLASYPRETIETIRRVVKTPGREVSFVRLTSDEKGKLVDLVYDFKRRGRRTTENEINRIAVNFILEDYAANRDNSVLARVIDALLA